MRVKLGPTAVIAYRLRGEKAGQHEGRSSITTGLADITSGAYQVLLHRLFYF